MEKRFVLGDPHGGHKALLQVFERCKFDYKKDELIVLGDVCNGWPESRQCIEELLKIENCNLILGNHDEWALQWMLHSLAPAIWTSQGGDRTIESYGSSIDNVPKDHINFLRNATLYIEADDCLFVHAGLEQGTPITEQRGTDLLWDRILIEDAYFAQQKADGKKIAAPNLTGYREVFIGHTTTLHFNSILPVKYCEIWNLDTGGGWGGKLTIMDRDSHKYWQSDVVKGLYPGVKGR